jgi:hypothetical protein
MPTRRIAKAANICLLVLSIVFISNAALRISRTYHFELDDGWLEFGLTIAFILIVCAHVFVYLGRFSLKRARAFGRMSSVTIAATTLVIAIAVSLTELFLPFPMRTRVIDEKSYQGYFYRLYESGCGVPCKPSVAVTKETRAVAGIRLVKPIWVAAAAGRESLVHSGDIIEVRVGSRTVTTIVLKE